jgi:hypothetical protein
MNEIIKKNTTGDSSRYLGNQYRHSGNQYGHSGLVPESKKTFRPHSAEVRSPGRRALAATAAALLILLTGLSLAQGVSAAPPARMTSVTVVVTQAFTVGPEDSAGIDGSFTYRLTPRETNASAPLPNEDGGKITDGGYNFTLDGDGASQNIVVGFAAPGTYEYLLRCVMSPKPSEDYTVDTRTYRLKVVVAANMSAGAVVYDEENSKDKTNPAFAHSYTAPDTAGAGETGDDGKTGDDKKPGDDESQTTPETPGTPENSGNTGNQPTPTPAPSAPDTSDTSDSSDSTLGMTETENPGPPAPSRPGGSIVPSDNGTFIELDEDGTPLGEWKYDPEQNAWIFDEYPPLTENISENLPQTGQLRWPVPALTILGVLMLTVGFAWNRKRAKNGRESSQRPALEKASRV